MSLGLLIDQMLGLYINKDEESRSRIFMESLIEAGRKKINIVTGEFDKSFYTLEIGRCISNCLKRGAEVNILLTEKDSNDNTNSIKLLVSNNYYFFFPIYKDVQTVGNTSFVFDNLTFYFSRKRPKNHFAVIDNDVFLESYHEKEFPRSVYIKKSSSYFSNKYNYVFDKMIESEFVYKVSTKEIFNSLKSIIENLGKNDIFRTNSTCD